MDGETIDKFKIMFEIHYIPIYKNNYVWILTTAGDAWVIDPGDCAPVEHFLQAHQLRLRAILITHRHWDHINGVSALLQAHADQEIPVYGPDSEPLRGLVSHVVNEGDSVAIGPYQAQIWQIPGHTLDHISYYIEPLAALFCGDTLFACGCGKLFDGTMEQLFASLARIAALPPATEIYCAHEYTLANIQFALTVDPHNPQLQARQKHCQQLRQRQLPTLPTQLALELASNPFLRCHDPDIQNAVKKETNASSEDAFSCFAALRHWKNRY